MDSNTNFSFAFNDPKFSDRVLSIEITPDPHGTRPILTATRPILIANQSSHGVVMKLLKGDEAPWKHDVTRSKDLSTIVLRKRTLHINSAILAAKSPFFFKLFSNGMGESEQRVATLRIHASEEVALMELLNFMYNSTLSPAAPSCLLDILMAADKYDVATCIQYCSQRISRFPVTLNFALRCLDLPSSVLHIAILQQLINSAKQFIADRFKDIEKFETEVLKLPLHGIEAILSSNDIQVPSEDFVYDLVLKWAKFHYPVLEERRGVLERHLRHLIRFSYMTSRKLREVTRGNNFSPEVASEIVLEALVFKTETPYTQRRLASGRQDGDETIVNTDHRFVERAYMYRPVQVVELVLPRHHCVVYLDLKREECVCLFPARKISSEPFHLGRQSFFLSAYCNMDHRNQYESQCFGLYLGMLEKGSASFAVYYEFSYWSKEEGNYKAQRGKHSYTFTGGKSMGFSNLFDTTWAAFIADDSPYFINGILHLRAVVGIN